jgi:hypothetical protein
MKKLLRGLLWTDHHAMWVAGLPLGRRVTVARGATGQLVVFSPVRASQSSVDELARLGAIAAFVLPSRFHDSLYEDYFDRFPEACFVAGRSSIDDHPKWPLKEISHGLPELMGFKYLVLAGMPKVQEHVFFHEASKTLILADSMFNIPDAKTWPARVLMRVAAIGGKPGPSRLFRFLIQSRREFAASLREVLSWDFERIIGGHGVIIETDGKSVFESAFVDFLQKA